MNQEFFIRSKQASSYHRRQTITDIIHYGKNKLL